MPRGILFLVVGPSGAGKDSLIAGAEKALAGDDRYVFARRVITRAGDASGENHMEAAAEDFAASAATGGFLLSWRAHEAEYGIPARLGDDLAAGRHVVANVSRAVIAEAVSRYPPVQVIEVIAPFAERVERLVGRGREDAGAIGDRLARRPAPLPAGTQAITVANDGDLEPGVRRFLAALGASPRI